MQDKFAGSLNVTTFYKCQESISSTSSCIWNPQGSQLKVANRTQVTAFARILVGKSKRRNSRRRLGKKKKLSAKFFRKQTGESALRTTWDSTAVQLSLSSGFCGACEQLTGVVCDEVRILPFVVVFDDRLALTLHEHLQLLCKNNALGY